MIKHFKTGCFQESELVAKRDFKSLASTSFATRANTVFDTDRLLLSGRVITIIPQESLSFSAVHDHSDVTKIPFDQPVTIVDTPI